jgi:hypothetical protein
LQIWLAETTFWISEANMLQELIVIKNCWNHGLVVVFRLSLLKMIDSRRLVDVSVIQRTWLLVHFRSSFLTLWIKFLNIKHRYNRRFVIIKNVTWLWV